MVRLYIYEEGFDKPATEILEASVRCCYYAAMSYIRTCRHDGDEVPYMRSDCAKLNYLLTCKRMLVNFGFAE